jgi:ParB-like chromosome segregation protein Spo0J
LTIILKQIKLDFLLPGATKQLGTAAPMALSPGRGNFQRGGGFHGTRHMPTEAHEYAEIFPLHEGQTLFELSEDIKKNGQREPIVLLDGKVLDGRRREKACENAGVTPKYRKFGSIPSDGSDPLDFVWSKNFHRRHLTANERAFAAALYSTAEAGRPKSAQLAPISEPVTREEAADKFGVSVDAVKRARAIVSGGSKALVDAVKKEEVSISDAASVVSLPKKEQTAAVKAVLAGDAGTVREAAKTLSEETNEAAIEEESEAREETIADQIKRVNSSIETFCRDLMKFFNENCPDDPWISEEGTLEGARKKVQNACSALRTAKCEAECSKCGGGGCQKCYRTGRMPKFVLEQMGLTK